MKLIVFLNGVMTLGKTRIKTYVIFHLFNCLIKNDLRPAYQKLSVLKETFSNVPIMALTATATPRVRIDILRHLAIKSSK